MKRTTITACLDPKSERAPDWIRDYGSLEVPVLSPVPVFHAGPDGMLHAWYCADVDALTQEQIERAIAFVVERFGLTPEEVRSDIDGECGMPILADDVVIAFQHPFGLSTFEEDDA